jgi:hypothetical protein
VRQVAIDKQKLAEVLAVGAASHDGLVPNAIFPCGRELKLNLPVELEALQFAEAGGALDQLSQLPQILDVHGHQQQLDRAQIWRQAKNLQDQSRLRVHRIGTADVEGVQVLQSVRSERRRALRTAAGLNVQLAEGGTRVQQPVQPLDSVDADAQRAQLASHAVSDDAHQIVLVREVHVELGQVGEAVGAEPRLLNGGVVQVQHAHLPKRNEQRQRVEGVERQVAQLQRQRHAHAAAQDLRGQRAQHVQRAAGVEGGQFVGGGVQMRQQLEAQLQQVATPPSVVVVRVRVQREQEFLQTLHAGQRGDSSAGHLLGQRNLQHPAGIQLILL